MKDNNKMSHNFKLSIVIPVFKEGDKINSLIEHIRYQDLHENYEIIVVDGDPKGETISAISNKEVLSVVSPLGRAQQMNAGASVASGDILIFLHADTHLPRDGLRKISLVMKQEKYVGGAFNLGIFSDSFLFKAIAYLASLRSRFTRIPYGDQAIFIRRDYFNRIGRYKGIPLMEDVELMRRIKKLGDSIFIIPERVSTSPRRWEEEGIIRCTLRNWTISTLYFMGVSPHRLKRFYRSGYDVYKE